MSTVASTRLDSIDLLRGLVMVIMALDHVRDFFTDVRYDPLDLTQTSPVLFLTRWITHFCAPTFVFLAGVSAYFVSRRRTRRELSVFLLSRGAWLVLLELTVVYWTWTFDFTFQARFFLQVIWAIGVSMMLLSALAWLPTAAVGVIGCTLIAAHNLFDGVEPAAFGAAAPIWQLFHVPGPLWGGFALYPLVPWIGVMAAGFAFGSVYALPTPQRRSTLLLLGSIAIVLFVALRWDNFYGDAQAWWPQGSLSFSLLSFINTVKYPPSLLFLLMTLGPGFLLLAAFEHARGPVADFFITIGRVPLFFYVLHVLVAHLAAGIVMLMMEGDATLLAGVFLSTPPGWGFGLGVVYGFWILVVALLFPACRWFSGVKARRKDWWLSYL